MSRTTRGRLLVVVGPGGVGKTTLASGLAVRSARSGARTLVITFDPSRRLAALLGVDTAAAAGAEPCAVPGVPGLFAALVEPRATFDRVVAEHSPDEDAKQRVLRNRYYDSLAGRLAGVFEYMAVERLFELHATRRFERIVLDTPPARNALDFLHAPQRIVDFVSGGIARFAARDWFDADGRLRGGPLGRGAAALIESTIGLDIVRDVTEFFSAFRPLFDGFRERADAVGALLAQPGSAFLLATAPTPARVPEAMRFARALADDGLRLAAIAVNRVHPAPRARGGDGLRFLSALARRDDTACASLEELLSGTCPVVRVPMRPSAPVDPEALAGVTGDVAEVLGPGWT